jgi:hypothetical protein
MTIIREQWHKIPKNGRRSRSQPRRWGAQIVKDAAALRKAGLSVLQRNNDSIGDDIALRRVAHRSTKKMGAIHSPLCYDVLREFALNY